MKEDTAIALLVLTTSAAVKATYNYIPKYPHAGAFALVTLATILLGAYKFSSSTAATGWPKGSTHWVLRLTVLLFVLIFLIELPIPWFGIFLPALFGAAWALNNGPAMSKELATADNVVRAPVYGPIACAAAVCIVAAIAAEWYVAVSNRTSQAREGTQSGQWLLQGAESRMQRHYIANNSYTDDPNALGDNGYAASIDGCFKLTIDPCADGSLSECYLLTASRNGRCEHTDSDLCNTLTLDSHGARRPVICWKR